MRDNKYKLTVVLMILWCEFKCLIKCIQLHKYNIYPLDVIEVYSLLMKILGKVLVSSLG